MTPQQTRDLAIYLVAEFRAASPQTIMPSTFVIERVVKEIAERVEDSMIESLR